MLRAVLTLTGTAAGLAALLSFKSHPATFAAAQPAASPATSGATSKPAPTSAATTHPAAGKSPTASKSQTAAGNGQAAAVRTVTGAVANTQYGPMQVQLTLTGQKITKVTVLQRTDDGAESDEIDSTAIPKLTSETLAAQSAQVNAVSGASYTSSGYIQSLQSALDKAK
ncbi:MAG TPA: FMN-binding protein [Trebonia sp.]|jgi:uncharacterized protein with FMN-binding domain|nr:FMN-binding protein [Trebonia sp.]